MTAGMLKALHEGSIRIQCFLSVSSEKRKGPLQAYLQPSVERAIGKTASIGWNRFQ